MAWVSVPEKGRYAMGSTFSTIWCRRLYPPGLRMVVATVMGQIPAANSLSQLKYSAPPAKEMRILPLNWREMRWHISMVRGNRLRPDMYISLLGSSPRVVSTGKVLDSFRPNSRPQLSARACRRSNMGTASAHCRSSLKWCSSKTM